MEEELQFWVKGQGQIRERGNTAEEGNGNVFDEENAVKELDMRMTKLETQMSDLLATIKDGFETMEASQEVAFRAFYNAQKRQRQMNSPGSLGHPRQQKLSGVHRIKRDFQCILLSYDM